MSDHPDRPPRERDESLCPCKSRATYAACCRPFHVGKAKPETAEELMRSRYSAYFFRLIDYLVETHHPDTREPNLKQELKKTIYNINWNFLTVHGTSKGTKTDKQGKVEFTAIYYLGPNRGELHERSRFKRHKGAWRYYDDKG